MTSPVGSTWRNAVTGPEWAHESSYSPTNFATLTAKLQDAIDAVNDATTADQDGGNSGYPL